MDKKVRFAMVGAGAIAQSYIQALEDCPDACLVAVADVRQDAARSAAERIGCEYFPSYQVMSRHDDLYDAVIICTPPSTHEEISLHFLSRKIHVLCEKPFAVDVRGAHRMLQASREAGVKLTMGSKFRYVDDVIRAKGIVLSGILGDIVLYENTFTSRTDMTSRWNSDARVSGGGVLIDNGSHSVDVMRYLLGPIAALQVVEGKRVQGLSVEDTALIVARSESGVMGRIDLSWSIHKENDYYINIHGSNGTLSVGWKQSRFRQTSSPDWVPFGKGYDKVQAFRSQIQNFAMAIREGEPLHITAEDAVASVEVVAAAYRALRSESWVDVEAGLPATRSHRPSPLQPAAGGVD